MIGGVGLSPKKFEIGGVAPPNESPAATSTIHVFVPVACSLIADSASYVSNHALRYAEPPMANVGGAGGSGNRVRRLGERRELGVVVADVEDGHLLQVLA